jgi:glycosyltransferase involved in cell wall biosynthesis
MPSPVVTVVVPCYRLGRYLPECVASIAAQSYDAIEILILDDHSPDDTPEVSRRIIASTPSRDIRYVRHEANLGNIRNYNAGIRLARGRYVWILSPDDRLRNRDVVRTYVDLLEARPEVGYVFCPAHAIEGDEDRGLYRPSWIAPRDRIFHGRAFVGDLIENRFELVSPSVLMRKACYDEITMFPEHLPHRGDTYVWALSAMRYDVAYVAEPMVDYRIHAGSMMSTLARENPRALVDDEIGLQWAIRAAADERGLAGIARHCDDQIVRITSKALIGINVRGQLASLPVSAIDATLAPFMPHPRARARLRARILCAYGDRLYWAGRCAEASAAYREAAAACDRRAVGPRLVIAAKRALARSGRFGIVLRTMLGRARRLAGNHARA